MVTHMSAYTDKDILSSLVEGKESVLQVPVDILDSEDQFIIIAQVPGVTSDALNISVSGQSGVVVIEGMRSSQWAYEQSLTEECSWGEIYRRLILPESVVSSTVSAELTDGVLTVQLQKAAYTADNEYLYQ